MVSYPTKVSDQKSADIQQLESTIARHKSQTPAESKNEANGNSLLQRCISSTKVSADTTRMETKTAIGISRKTATLFMLLLEQRVNTLSLMKVTNMFLTENECTFIFDEVLLHSRPGYRQAPLILRDFPDNEILCPIRTIRQYLDYRLEICNDNGLFVTTTTPHKQCSNDTISRWVKATLE